MAKIIPFPGLKVIELPLKDALPEYDAEELEKVYSKALRAHYEKLRRDQDNAIIDRFIEKQKEQK